MKRGACAAEVTQEPPEHHLGPRIARGCLTSSKRSLRWVNTSASGSVLLGLDGFEVLAAQVVGGEWQLEVQTTATAVGCGGCRMRPRPTAAAW
jgi:hypothetical protein